MNRLFIFEDETPIKFYVDKKLVDCERILAVCGTSCYIVEHMLMKKKTLK